MIFKIKYIKKNNVSIYMEKTKTVNINEDLHKKIKVYCAENGLKINDWISKVLDESIKSKKK